MRLKRNIFLCAIFLLISSTAALSQGYKVTPIVIDAGHGGDKPGAAGSYSLEKNVTLQVALKLGRKFEEDMPGVKIVYTRKTDILTCPYTADQKLQQLQKPICLSLFTVTRCQTGKL